MVAVNALAALVVACDDKTILHDADRAFKLQLHDAKVAIKLKNHNKKVAATLLAHQTAQITKKHTWEEIGATFTSNNARDAAQVTINFNAAFAKVTAENAVAFAKRTVSDAYAAAMLTAKSARCAADRVALGASVFAAQTIQDNLEAATALTVIPDCTYPAIIVDTKAAFKLKWNDEILARDIYVSREKAAKQLVAHHEKNLKQAARLNYTVEDAILLVANAARDAAHQAAIDAVAFAQLTSDNAIQFAKMTAGNAAAAAKVKSIHIRLSNKYRKLQKTQSVMQSKLLLPLLMRLNKPHATCNN